MDIPDDELISIAKQVALLAFSIVAVLTTAKQIARAAGGPKALDGRVAQVLLRIAPLMMGAAGGVVDGFFDGYSPGPRALLGLVAGFMSPTVYKLVADRLPNVMGAKDARWRKGSGTDAPPGE